jgi:hypothetical protein
MKLIKSGMNVGAAHNYPRTQVESLANVDEERRARRLKEIPGMVESARLKLEAAAAPQPAEPDKKGEEGVRLRDFVAYMQSNDYVYLPAGDFWPTGRVNARLPPIPLLDARGQPIIDEDTKEPETIKASAWLAQNAPV